MNQLEIEILKAIGKHYPELFGVLGKLQVSSRNFTGAGCFTNFEALDSPLPTAVQVLDLHGTVVLSTGCHLSAHIQLKAGVPEYLEICCLTEGGWNGEFGSFEIAN